MEQIIDCPKCNSNVCFTTAANETIKTYYCFGCGYQSNSIMTEGHQFMKEQLEVLPELYKDLLWEDPTTKQQWLPTSVNNHEKGLIFAKGTNKDDWKWAAVKQVPITDENRTNYSDKHTHKPDMTTMKLFEQCDFIEALDYLNLL
jgi:hypothetical protein